MHRINLVCTSPPGGHGSMERYASLVLRALSRDVAWLPRRVDLASPARKLSLFPRRLRPWVQHACILARARRAFRVPGKADLWHVLDGSHAYVAAGLPEERTIVTCHDLIPLRQLRGLIEGRPSPFARPLIQRSAGLMRRVARVIAVSLATAADLAREAAVQPERTSVVLSPVDPVFREAAKRRASKAKKTGGGTPSVVLHVGHNGIYKNRAGVLRVIARIATETDVRLIMAGEPPNPTLRKLASSLGVGDRVEFAGNADDDTLGSLYAEADVFLFPSLYEGFGWPVLEAMTFGCPVVCSRASSLPEVVGEAAITADARDESSLARHCVKVLQDQVLAERLSRLGRDRASLFTLEKLATGLGDVYGRVLATN